MPRWGPTRRLGFTAMLSVTVSPDLLHRLDAASRARGVTRSALVRSVLTDWLERHPIGTDDDRPTGENVSEETC